MQTDDSIITKHFPFFHVMFQFFLFFHVLHCMSVSDTIFFLGRTTIKICMDWRGIAAYYCYKFSFSFVRIDFGMLMLWAMTEKSVKKKNVWDKKRRHEWIAGSHHNKWFCRILQLLRKIKKKNSQAFLLAETIFFFGLCHKNLCMHIFDTWLKSLYIIFLFLFDFAICLSVIPFCKLRQTGINFVPFFASLLARSHSDISHKFTIRKVV